MRAVRLLGRIDRRIERVSVAARDVQLGTERRHHIDAIAGLELGGEAMQVSAGDDPGAQTRLRDHLFRRALGEQFAEGDIG